MGCTGRDRPRKGSVAVHSVRPFVATRAIPRNRGPVRARLAA